jgi:transposase-like protein
MKFNNLIEVTTTFADQQKATDYLIKMRWNGNVTCPSCNHDRVYELKGENKRFKCAKCRTQFSATKGTIFENSAIPLQKWFVGIYLITSHKKGISSHQLAKDLSITQKSAWFLLHRVRFALQSGTFVHSKDAIIEIDEAYIGGEAKNKHANKKTKNYTGNTIHEKTPVLGMLERGGNISARVVESSKKKHILPEIKKAIAPMTIIMTDTYSAYKDLSDTYFHETVNHTSKEYVRGMCHTNGIENFWSLFKRGVVGIYHHTSEKHLDKYLDEFEFRFNTRKSNEVERFEKMVSLCGKRLTYQTLIS